MHESADLITSLQKKDMRAYKELFDNYYPVLYPISLRYSKSNTQAEELFNYAFSNCTQKLLHQKQAKQINLQEFLIHEFILECVAFIKSIRSEYYVSSTVNATETSARTYDLFDTNDWVDFNQVETDIVISSLQQLVPSQRLVFNLHVIDGFNMNDAIQLLESSEGTVKSNLEKARYHLQKNIEKNLKSMKS